MNAPLVIGPAERTAIQEAMERAREHPVSIETVARRTEEIPREKLISLGDRRDPRPLPHETISLPFGYQVCINYEEQLAGLCLHLSMSTPTPAETLPNVWAMAMVLDAMGFECPLTNVARTWIEEFSGEGGKLAGRCANIVILVEEQLGGTKQ